MRPIRCLPLLLAAVLSACGGGHHTQRPIPTPATPQPPAQATPGKAGLPPTETVREGGLLRLNYEGFTVWLDCKERAAVKFRYNAQRDTGHEPRAEDFKLDPSVPKECQQTSAAAYGQGYDRGHQVPANHLDASPVSIKQSNYMTNILPQASNMNRGAWLLTEEIVECYRDIDELLVLGGVIWGNNAANDLFVKSHGVRTPDAFWKVVVRGNGNAIAWIVPNTKDATKAKLDGYLVTVADIEKRTGEKLPVTGDARTTKPKGSWVVPVGCDKG
ncbi:endonuclease G [Methylomagnum ishizawai]|uniref:Endonuclease G n=1 Tax=Methylomagnum ishizawai TaxID=1760988 RepID=A0A1Y6D0I7_9GAMM|nr:DNA/RNA non-specific endonuclease [Methylomagnum ishizawai]SMF96147.1 endonuclease G [Methylomagnum ishizawai]